MENCKEIISRLARPESSLDDIVEAFLLLEVYDSKGCNEEYHLLRKALEERKCAEERRGRLLLDEISREKARKHAKEIQQTCSTLLFYHKQGFSVDEGLLTDLGSLVESIKNPEEDLKDNLFPGVAFCSVGGLIGSSTGYYIGKLLRAGVSFLEPKIGKVISWATAVLGGLPISMLLDLGIFIPLYSIFRSIMGSEDWFKRYKDEIKGYGIGSFLISGLIASYIGLVG